MRDYKTASLADQVFDKLENDIIFGIYARGEVLTELKLAEQLGVSRTPIREALRRLEQERLIEDTGKGSVVLGITDDDLLDIMNIRVQIEGLATYYATINMTPEGLSELRHMMDLQDFYYSKGDTAHLQTIDDGFHDMICRLSKRNVIYDTLSPLHRRTRRYRRKSLDNQERIPHIISEHRSIFNAIAAGDARLAKELTTRHVENARKSMLGV